jgi:hypothetical protein
MTYSNTLALGRHASLPSRNQNAVSFRSRGKRLGPVSNTIVLIVLACLLGLLYLTQVTKTNAYGYQLNGLASQQSKLQAQHNDLEVTAAQLQSASRVQASGVAGALTPEAPAGTVH